MMQWQVTRLVEHREGVEWTVQTAGGGATGGAGADYTDINVDVACIEQQGFASGVGVGARGLVCPYIGGVPGEAAGFGLRKKSDRPTFLQDWEACVYQPVGSRLWLSEDGQVRLEAGLADYRDDPADHDEGAKLRLHWGANQGDAELYGEHAVRIRAQAPESAPPEISLTMSIDDETAVVKAETNVGQFAKITLAADGSLTMQTTSGASSATVTLSPAGHITLTPAAVGGEVRVGGEAGLLAGARSTDPVNPGVAMGTWASVVEAAINLAVPGTFTGVNNFAPTVAIPVDSGNFGSIGSASAVVKLV